MNSFRSKFVLKFLSAVFVIGAVIGLFIKELSFLAAITYSIQIVLINAFIFATIEAAHFIKNRGR